MVKKKELLPSKDTLLEILHYEESTGKLFWKMRPKKHFTDSGRGRTIKKRAFDRRYARKEAFIYTEPLGYVAGSIFSVRVRAHRVIWKMHFGTEPECIDHINHIKNDNRIENLRSVTQAKNRKNIDGMKRDGSFLGVEWNKKCNKWRARIGVEGKSIYLGVFTKKSEAIEARKNALQKYDFHENHGLNLIDGNILGKDD